MRLLVSGTTATLKRILPKWRDSLGFLTTPRNGNAMETVLSFGIPWAADNDCFQGLNEDAYRRMLARITGQPRCLWVTVPDRVGDARETLRLWAEWSPVVAATGQPMAFVGQDGIENLEPPWEQMSAWFVGGSTKWKLSQASADLASEAKRRGKAVHVGRVNSLVRLRRALDMGADTIDGTGMSRWGDCHLEKFCRWLAHERRQLTLPGSHASTDPAAGLTLC